MTSQQIQHLAILLPLAILWVASAIHVHANTGMSYPYAIAQGVGFAALMFVCGYAMFLFVGRPLVRRIARR